MPDTEWIAIGRVVCDTREKGDTGYAFTYDVFTPEQFASLKCEMGETGPAEPKGDTGNKGEAGATGSKGGPGFKGDTGYTEPTGNTGLAGGGLATLELLDHKLLKEIQETQELLM